MHPNDPLPLPLPLPAPVGTKTDSTGGLIPYRNPQALIAYYAGVFSVIPFFGFIAALVAVPLGIMGLRKRKENPALRGTVHAWIGIVLGGLSILAHVAIVVIPLTLALMER